MNTAISTSVGHHERLTIEPNRELVELRLIYVVGFLLLHIPLAILMRQVSIISTLHALATFAVGFLWAISPRRSLVYVAYVGAYIAGAEVMWRMTNAGVFWEFGKYATIAIFMAALLRIRRLQGPMLPLIYFVLLLPAAVLTVTEVSLTSAQELVSFNLSGPLSLMICAWFFSHLEFSGEQRRRLFLAVLGPTLGISAIVIFFIMTAPSIYFTVGSNKALSGGYGPNQVSSILALGALTCFWYVFGARTSRPLRVLMIGLLLLFVTQSILTFSRGGLYTVVGSAVLAAFYLFRDPRMRVRLILAVALLFVIVNYVVWPRLDAWTNGMLSVRFLGEGASRTTGRDSIVEADLQIWREHPLYGVGPGRGQAYREMIISRDKRAHTEQTRMLAEHGLYGIIALLILLGMAGQRVILARTNIDKAFAASMVGFSLLYMLHAAIRLVTPAFVFGMTYATFLPEEEHQPHFADETGMRSTCGC